MSLRESSVYIHRKTLRRLWWVSKAKGVVADALADQILNEVLEAQYPGLIVAEKAVELAEKEFAASFGKTVNADVRLD